MKALVLLTTVAMCFADGALAQAPTWNVPSGASSLAKQPSNAVNRVAGTPNAVAATAGVPPKDRDCKSLVTQPEPDYVTRFGRAETNGYTSGPNVDLGFLINTTRGAANAVQGNLDDLQVRVEQLRCENQNIKAKLDFIIRALAPQ